MSEHKAVSSHSRVSGFHTHLSSSRGSCWVWDLPGSGQAELAQGSWYAFLLLSTLICTGRTDTLCFPRIPKEQSSPQIQSTHKRILRLKISSKIFPGRLPELTSMCRVGPEAWWAPFALTSSHGVSSMSLPVTKRPSQAVTGSWCSMESKALGGLLASLTATPAFFSSTDLLVYGTMRTFLPKQLQYSRWHFWRLASPTTQW